MVLSTAEKGAIFQKLSLKLDHECRLYEKYLKVITEEQNSVTKLSLDKMRALTAEREALLFEMNECQEERQKIVVSLGEGSQVKLSEVVKKHFSKDAAFLLTRKIDVLRKLVKKSQSLSNELNQVVAFSQRLANGCLAIFASASNNVFRSYSPFGKIKEAYHPSMGTRGTRRV